MIDCTLLWCGAKALVLVIGAVGVVMTLYNAVERAMYYRSINRR